MLFNHEVLHEGYLSFDIIICIIFITVSQGLQSSLTKAFNIRHIWNTVSDVPNEKVDKSYRFLEIYTAVK